MLAESAPQGVVVLGASALGRAVGVALRELGFAVLMVDANYKNISAARMAGMTVAALVGGERVA